MSTLVETPGLSLTSTADANDYGTEAPNDARDDTLNLDSNEKVRFFISKIEANVYAFK